MPEPNANGFASQWNIGLIASVCYHVLIVYLLIELLETKLIEFSCVID